MYYYIEGKLAVKEPTLAVIDVNGVGYEIHITTRTFEKFENVAIDSKVKLFTHHIVREDMEKIFGFYDIKDRDFFRILLDVNGIGPSQGIGILSATSAVEFVSMIRTADAKKLTKIPGIGLKKAEKIMFEFKDKVVDLEKQFSIIEHTITAISTPKLDEVSSALRALGYSDKEVGKTILKIQSVADENSVEQLLKLAMRELFK